MNLKKLLTIIFVSLTTIAVAEDSATKVKIYGYVGNDFFYNSRQNVEMVDGIIQLFPKPVCLNASNQDVNGTAQAEMLSVNSRLGADITGTPILGAKTSGKIEADFAGFSTTYYVFRIRQAYMKLNWDKTELLVGQTWHPLFGSIMPTTFSANAGGPFQPFNRSPQVRVKQTLTNTLSVSAAAIYEMQYASQGQLTATTTGASNVFMKNAIVPDLFVGLENKTTYWTTGAGIDFKTLKPDALNSATVSSLSAVAYAQYVNKKIQLKAKATFGENLSDQLMLGGYGVSQYGTGNDSTKVLGYTNYKNGNVWVNAVYGTKFQVGLLVGLSENMGTNSDLAINSKTKKFTSYGYGFYENTDLNANLKKTDASYFGQQILDHLYRIAPQVSYNLPNMKFGLEYDFTSAAYGTLQKDGTSLNNSTVNNHRILASVMYIF